MLLSFALAPLVTRLRRLGLPRVPAVLAAVLLAFPAIGGFGLLVGGQLAQLADNLPPYQQNIRAKIRSLQAAAPSGGLVEQASDMLHELGQELQQAQEQQTGRRGAAPPGGAGKVTIERATDEPITVRVEEPAPTPVRGDPRPWRCRCWRRSGPPGSWSCSSSSCCSSARTCATG